MKTINIKPSNLSKIIALANSDNENAIQGTQLEALYKLIQQKGEPIQCNEKDELNGLKCIELPNNQYLAITHHPYKKDSFYPCRIKTHLLKSIDE